MCHPAKMKVVLPGFFALISLVIVDSVPLPFPQPLPLPSTGMNDVDISSPPLLVKPQNDYPSPFWVSENERRPEKLIRNGTIGTLFFDEEMDKPTTPPSYMSPPTTLPVRESVNNLLDTITSSIRDVIKSGQQGLLRTIGSVDRSLSTVQDVVSNSSFSLVLQGQKAFARAYDRTPQSVNRFIQRIGTVRDSRLYEQLNEVVNLWRDNKKKLYDALEENQHDIHNVMQETWANVNQHLGVPNLPNMQFGWYR